uniref:Transcription termination factor MTEF1, chloroplastic n=1 Tax=Vitis vinifera TaxID=29760 RepID=A5C0L8_VITVI|nr:hypothetical protein VITISV_041212 [Vitis vinifera]
MKTKPHVWIKLRFLFSVSSSFFNLIPKTPVAKTRVWAPVAAISTITASVNESPVAKNRVWTQISRTAATTALINGTPDGNLVEVRDDHPINSTDVFRKWGCSDSEIAKIFVRRPSLRRADPNLIQSKLNVLSLLGLTSADLVKIINCRPRFLSCRINRCFDERIEFFLELFGSRDFLRKAIVRNPSLLIYDLNTDLVKIINCRPRFLSCRINRCFDERIEFFLELFGSRDFLRKAIVRNPSLLIYDLNSKIKRVVELYEGMGVARKDFILMVSSRPTMISRTSFNDEKLEYIRRTGVSKKSKMYKYVVVLMGISRLETIREKVGNLEKFGFSEDEVLGLFGRSPLVLTLSVDKVQRNMTYVLGTMKLPARAVLDCPFLLYANLEVVLKPRFLLAGKIEEMGLAPQIKGPKLFRALRMKEDRFLGAFVTCHPESLSNALMEYYRNMQRSQAISCSFKEELASRIPFLNSSLLPEISVPPDGAENALRTHFFKVHVLLDVTPVKKWKDTTSFTNLVKNMILGPGCPGLWPVFISPLTTTLYIGEEKE